MEAIDNKCNIPTKLRQLLNDEIILCDFREVAKLSKPKEMIKRKEMKRLKTGPKIREAKNELKRMTEKNVIMVVKRLMEIFPEAESREFQKEGKVGPTIQPTGRLYDLTGHYVHRPTKEGNVGETGETDTQGG